MQKTETSRALSEATGSASVVDLSQYTDLEILKIVSRERPEFVEALCAMADRGWDDDKIVRTACDAGGSPQAMRYTRKCIRALRSLC